MHTRQMLLDKIFNVQNTVLVVNALIKVGLINKDNIVYPTFDRKIILNHVFYS